MDGPAGSSSSSSLPSSHAIQNEEADVISEQLEEPSCARQQHAEKPTSQPLRQLAHIHCVSSDAWSDALHQSQGGSIDCAVEVRVDVQTAAAVKQAEAEQTPQPPKRQRRGLRCCAITVLVLGLLATGVLVPIAVTVGFKQDIAPVYRVLQPPQPAHRLIFAFESADVASSAKDALPPYLASQATSWFVMPTSGVHIASFASAQAQQQALTHLAGSTQPARSLLQSNSSSSSTRVLKYAVSDFRLVPDRVVTQVMDPIQLFDLAKQQARHLQQAYSAVAEPGGSVPEEDEDLYLDRLGQKDAASAAAGQRRQRMRKAAAAVAASGQSHGVPQTLQQQLASGQQTWHRQLQNAAVAPAIGSTPETELLPVMVLPEAGAAVHDVAAPKALAGSSGGSSSTRRSSWGARVHRALLQAAAGALPRRAALQLQPQQRQAQQQVQRGGSKVAWHLADAGLGVREAWNITSGLDRVVVAVIDSGVELASGAVGASLWTNAAEVAGDGLDNDGNGYTDDAVGWDFGGTCGDLACSFCAPGPDPTDTVGWGTHAAAVIAAQPEVASGTAGLAPGVQIMPLKVADCRHGTQLWDVNTAQGGLVKDLGSEDSSSSSGSDGGGGSAGKQLAAAQQVQQQDLGPMLLGSAALQALDYALLNGAHIVLAGWQAGPHIGGGGSSNSSSGGDGAGACFMGPDAAAAQGLSAEVAQGGAGCVEAVQRLLFQAALRPLQAAGVLVVTTQASSSSSSLEASKATSPAAAAAALPCSLSCEFDNLLCVAASDTMLPPAGSTGGAVDVLSAAGFFAPLTNQDGSSGGSYTDWLGSSSDGSSGSGTSSDDSSSSSSDGTSGSDDGSIRGGTPADAKQLAALSCDTRGDKGGSPWVQLRAPGTDIRAGWAWGSHAVVAGSSAAASVAAGVAALTWSQLGQTLGAEVSPGALEGLGAQVKQQLLQGSTLRAISSGSSSSSDGSDRASSSNLRSSSSGTSTTSDTARGSVTPSSSSSSNDGAAGPALELDLFGSLQESRAPEGLTLWPALLPAATTSTCRALRYSWHIQREEASPYDTDVMWYVARRALAQGALPLMRWEFYGTTSVLELSGYLEVTQPGGYELAVSSGDRFVLWLQDWWLHMRQPLVAASPADGAASSGAAGLSPDAWTTRVNFTAPGLYKLRAMVYAPSKPFNLQWKLPGASSFSSITSFLSLGQTQPLPQQLLQSTLLLLSGRADSSSERSSRGSGAGSAAQARVAGTSSSGDPSSAGPAGAAAPPAAPAPPAEGTGGSSGGEQSPDSASSSSAGAPPSDSGSSSGSSAVTPSTAPSSGSESDAALSDRDWGLWDDDSSQMASMEPDEGATDSHTMPELAADAVAPGVPEGVPVAGGAYDSSGTGPGPVYDTVGYVGPTQPGATPYVPQQQQPGYWGPAQAPNTPDEFWSNLRGFLGNGWFGRRRVSHHRRALLSVAHSTTSSSSSSSLHDASSRPGSSLQDASSRPGSSLQDASSRPGSRAGQAAGLQRRLAGAAARADPRPPKMQRSVKEAAARSSSSSNSRNGGSGGGSVGGGSGGGSIWGRFSLALSFVERTQYRTLMPDQTQLVFTHTGMLPGGSLGLTGWLQLQQSVLGYSDPGDSRGAYGIIQGWLDWRDLNPAAAAAISTAAPADGAASADPSGNDASGSSSSSGRSFIATEGAGLGPSGSGLAVAPAGVQFEVACESCSLQLDGMTVAGSFGNAEASACVTPASSSGGALFKEQQQPELLHLQMLFTTNDVRNTWFSVRSRPCSGLSSMSGSGAWQQLSAAGASPPALGVSSAAVKQGNGAAAFTRGMLCSVTAQLPPGQNVTATAAFAAVPGGGRGGSSGSGQGGGGDGSVLQQLVLVPASKMQEVIRATVNRTAPKPPPPVFTSSGSNAGPAVANSSNSSATNGTDKGSGGAHSTVDSPAGGPTEGDGTWEADSTKPDQMPTNSTSVPVNTADAAAAAAATAAAAQEVERQRRTAETAALARGLAVRDLVPAWVNSLPADTQYGFSCGCYWNGSWEGNVSLHVSAAGGSSAGSGGSSGRARLFLAGWPVAAKGRLWGPSDLDVRAYSTLLQRQQLAADSSSADPLASGAYPWGAFGSSMAAGGSGLGVAGGGSRITAAEGGDQPGGSSTSGTVLSAQAIRARRHVRLQQLVASQHGSNGGGGSSGSSAGSSMTGLSPLGSIDGVSRRMVMPQAGQHQLLVLQGEGLGRDDQVVVLAPGSGDGSNESGSSSSGSDGGSNGSSVAVITSWLPRPWDAWAPVG